MVFWGLGIFDVLILLLAYITCLAYPSSCTASRASIVVSRLWRVRAERPWVFLKRSFSSGAREGTYHLGITSITFLSLPRNNDIPFSVKTRDINFSEGADSLVLSKKARFDRGNMKVKKTMHAASHGCSPHRGGVSAGDEENPFDARPAYYRFMGSNHPIDALLGFLSFIDTQARQKVDFKAPLQAIDTT